jgi:inosine-uridine nucleoside N-ribohydrolase
MTRTPAAPPTSAGSWSTPTPGSTTPWRSWCWRRHPDVELVAVGTTHGNCTTERSSANARLVLDLCGREDVPVVGGSPAPSSASRRWHGPPTATTGWATAAGRRSRLRLPRRGGRRWSATSSWATSTRRPRLLALGPLTDLGAGLLVDPGLLRRFRSVTVMGGTGPWRAASTVTRPSASATRTPPRPRGPPGSWPTRPAT